MHTTKERIEALKKSRNAVILAHYYVPDEVQELADYVGDSFYLAKVAQQTQADSIKITKGSRISSCPVIF